MLVLNIVKKRVRELKKLKFLVSGKILRRRTKRKSLKRRKKRKKKKKKRKR